MVVGGASFMLQAPWGQALIDGCVSRAIHSESWPAPARPFGTALQDCRKTGIKAKLVAAGRVSNGFSIADPIDASMMDVVGFDTSAPTLIADFIRAE
ncbi:hypothetical protein [Lichenifustis flavocetrariae]|uniref:RNA-binding protein RO60 vWA domain-containing protein n=1 Tax=Lichenifustis flavocetrariae TaxID=2949735 RepID=A0AA41YTY3_9HYPH|nr:hypothetical protein [Lichenifustis flavocetrariae]MCW6507260.1 hypothetical protein [Lichenifustis flavocetrariae]